MTQLTGGLAVCQSVLCTEVVNVPGVAYYEFLHMVEMSAVFKRSRIFQSSGSAGWIHHVGGCSGGVGVEK